jgi:transcriptional regulator with XRE-family HTH domain
MNKFGEFLKQKRLENKMGLRKFARIVNIDPSYIIRIERGTVPPPGEKETLDFFAEALDFAPDSDEYKKLFDLSAQERGSYVPEDVKSKFGNPELIPIFLRTIAGKKLDKEEIESIVNYIKENY